MFFIINTIFQSDLSGTFSTNFSRFYRILEDDDDVDEFY